MYKVDTIIDNIVPAMLLKIRDDCIEKPFTAERSITVDQIDFVLDLMTRDRLSFIEAVRRLR